MSTSYGFLLCVFPIMNNPKNHHYVPRMYLEHFSGNQPKGQVWVYNLEKDSPFSSSPEETGKIGYYYAKKNSDGSRDFSIERYLSQIEGASKKIYDKLLSGQALGISERVIFSRFVAAGYLRSPYIRRRYAQTIANAVDILAQTISQDSGEVLDVQKKNGAIIISKEQTFSLFKYIRHLSDTIFKTFWTVLIPKNGYFITSDSPVCAINANGIHDFHGSLEGYAISFPLTPKHLLLMVPLDIRENLEIRVDKIGRQQVEFFNKLRVEYCDMCLFSHILDKRVHKMAKLKRGKLSNQILIPAGKFSFSPVFLKR